MPAGDTGLGELPLTPAFSWILSVPCAQSLSSCPSLSPCPRTHLRSSSHLPHEVVGDDIGQQPQQAVACLGVTVEPALGLGHCIGATAFNHVGHERPLREERSGMKRVMEMEGDEEDVRGQLKVGPVSHPRAWGTAALNVPHLDNL